MIVVRERQSGSNQFAIVFGALLLTSNINNPRVKIRQELEIELQNRVSFLPCDIVASSVYFIKLCKEHKFSSPYFALQLAENFSCLNIDQMKYGNESA